MTTSGDATTPQRPSQGGESNADLTAPKPGDRVFVEAQVFRIIDGEVEIVVGGRGFHHFVSPDLLASAPASPTSDDGSGRPSE